ncbi:MAG: DUF1080 domain-containing protein [Verrucomicrobiota bacterium]
MTNLFVRLQTRFIVSLFFVFVLGIASQAADSEGELPLMVADFEDENFIAGNNTTHQAQVTLVRDRPESGGDWAAKTLVDSAADAPQFFGTGFPVSAVDLSASARISFWIKTDVESQFNFQLHSADNGTSVFPFSTIGSKEKWLQITAPLASFSKPRWSKGKADLKRISKIQVTAFRSGPYDGKTLILDQVIGSGGTVSQPGEEKLSVQIRKERQARLKEPTFLKRGQPIEMFDGQTLNGWFATPRVYVPRSERFAKMPTAQLYEEVINHYKASDGQTNRVVDRERVNNLGVWEAKNGVITGGQMPGSIAGSYLMSEKTYGDFELTLEANPDYPIDTGIMVRAHRLGSVGFQVLVDNRPNGTIGGVFGNSVGMFFAYPFVFDGDEKPGNRIANLRPGAPDALKFPGGQFKTDYAASLEEFLTVWKPNDWNEIKIRCTGHLPLIETWINGVAIAKLDTATLADQVPGYDAEAIFERIGRKGHIGLEVHDSPKRERWAPGAKCRWRNVILRELEVREPMTADQAPTQGDGPGGTKPK